GRITTTGTISEFPLSSSTNVDTENWPATLYGGTLWGDITTGPDHAVWFTEPSLSTSENGRIGRITPTGTISEFPVPDPLCNVNGITAGPDNAIWFTEDTTNHNEKGKIGRVTLTGAISEFPLPTPSGGPASITVGPDDNLWFTEVLGNKLGHLI
ncbi:MAG: Vgb family protein, partial [Ktedonobacteraceae bacterium]